MQTNKNKQTPKKKELYPKVWRPEREVGERLKPSTEIGW